MNLLSPILALALSGAPTIDVPEKYVAVTETEYSLELVLAPSGRAVLTASTWEADESSEAVTRDIKGSWTRTDTGINVVFDGNKFASFELLDCLSYSEFGRTGCSPGLKLSSTNLSPHWGLQRFGLWRSEGLRIGS